MLQKTQQSQLSTNIDPKTSSFYTPIARQMFKSSKKSTSTRMTPSFMSNNNNHNNDVVVLTPTIVNNLAWPGICLVDSQVSVGVKGNYYQICGLRGRRRYVQRNGQVQGEIVYFFADKPTKTINIVSIQRYLNQQQLTLHLNLSKYDPQQHFAISHSLHLPCLTSKNQSFGFCCFQTIDHNKKGIIITKINHKNSHYRVMLLDLQSASKGYEAKKEEVRVVNCVDIDCQALFGREEEKVLRTVKSQFGDIVLLITNMEVYQIQVQDMGQGLKLCYKPYNLPKTLSTLFPTSTTIISARFISNGLKLMLLTSTGHLMVVQAGNYLFGGNIHQLMIKNGMDQKYQVDQFVFENVYPVNSSIAVEFGVNKHCGNLIKEYQGSQKELNQHQEILKKGVLIVKIQGHNLTPGKILNLHLDPKELLFLKINQIQGIDQMLIQHITKNHPYILQITKLRILVMELNALTKISEIQYNYTHHVQNNQLPIQRFQPQYPQKMYHSVAVPAACRVFYLLRDNELSCYKIYSEIQREKFNKEICCLFSHSFFEKPIKITVNPLTLQFAIVFRQFVKFFFFDYTNLKHFHTLKLKNIPQVKYLQGGNKILLATTDGIIYLLDAYTYEQKVLMEFYGEVFEADLVEENILVVRSGKNVVSLFRKETEEDKEFKKVYEVRLEEGDLYNADQRQIIVLRKKGVLQVYGHEPMSVPNDIVQTQKQCYTSLLQIHPYLHRKVTSLGLSPSQTPTSLLLSQQLGFLFLSTSHGNVYQYLWPLAPPTTSSAPQHFNQHLSDHKIIKMTLDARLSHLYLVSEDGNINQMQIQQFINGEEMPYVYVFSEKTRKDQMQKRQFTDRNYFMDHFTTISTEIVQNCQQSIEEYEFFLDKLKDDLDEMTKNVAGRGKKRQIEFKCQAKQKEKHFKDGMLEAEKQYSGEIDRLNKQIEEQERAFEEEKAKQVEKYQKQLLVLYRQSDRLKSILKTQDQKMTSQRNAFLLDFQTRLKSLHLQMQLQQSKMRQNYGQIQTLKQKYELQNQIYTQEQEIQMQLFKNKIHQQEQNELDQAEDMKERLLGENAKKEKEINNLKQRGNYFQSLILETKVQINELTKDQGQYDQKKQYLQVELNEKQSIIEKIERQLVIYLKNTQDMKTIKNTHEFELEQYEKQVTPITQNHNKIQHNVKHMNNQIMNEYNNKVVKMDQIKELRTLSEQLKEKKKNTVVQKLKINNKCNRVIEKLVQLATHPFEGDIKMELRQLLEDQHAEIYHKKDEEREKQRKEGEKLVRYKNMVRREIEEQEKREQNIVRNQHQFYKYHKQNTALVRQFNQLKKTQNYLSSINTKLTQQLDALKSSLFSTPLRRIPSVSLHNKRPQPQHKLTPFQRYQEEQALVSKKHPEQQDTSDTRLTRASQSVSFLKGLMKEMNQSQSKYEKMEVMRERVRTFVNPEIKNKQKTEEIKKMLFGRTRGTSQMLKLK